MKFEEYKLKKDVELGVVDLKDGALFDSQSLFKEMAVLNPNSIFKIQNALQFIHKHNIQGVLIGGMAVSHFTQDRPLTPDIDFLVVNMSELKTILQQERIPFEALISSGMASDGAAGGIHVPSLDADFLDVNQGNSKFNHYILQTATTARIGGSSIPIINPIVLLIRKFDLGREKDLEDAFKLLPTVPLSALKTHLKAVQNMLKGDVNAKTIWDYAKSFSLQN